MRLTRLFLTCLVLAGVVAAGSACGRKGDLDTPFEAQTDARREAEKAKTQPLPPAPQPPETDQRFILDGLID